MYLGPGGSTALGLCSIFCPAPGHLAAPLTLFGAEVSTALQAGVLARTREDLMLALSYKTHICTSKAAAHPSSPCSTQSPFSCLPAVPVPIPLASSVGLDTSAVSPVGRGAYSMTGLSPRKSLRLSLQNLPFTLCPHLYLDEGSRNRFLAIFFNSFL